MVLFADLKLIAPLRRAVEQERYTHPTPIQASTIPLLLQGRDVLGCAQTGTGKTAAFALPLLQKMTERPNGSKKRRLKALVLSPTRELAAQIDESFGTYGKFLPIKHTVIYGGVGQTPQVRALRNGVDVLTATPGRLLDLMAQGHIDLSHVEFFVLDEADRMLDMGFIHDIKKVIGHLPRKRQNLLFSATMVRSIEDLGSSFLQNPAWIEVTPEAKTVDTIDQCVMFVSRDDKLPLIADMMQSQNMDRVLVFTRTKHRANRLVKQLYQKGIRGVAIHGNKTQRARSVALKDFKSGKSPVMVATDLASRGIDVDNISHVVNFDLPNESETYIHRIGRTGRAGKQGVAISLCDETEGAFLRDIENLVGYEIPIERDQPFHNSKAELIPGVKPPPPPASHFGNRGNRSEGGRRKDKTHLRGKRSQRKPPQFRSGQRSHSNAEQSNGSQEANAPNSRSRNRSRSSGTSDQVQQLQKQGQSRRRNNPSPSFGGKEQVQENGQSRRRNSRSSGEQSKTESLKGTRRERRQNSSAPKGNSNKTSPGRHSTQKQQNNDPWRKFRKAPRRR